MRKERQRQPYIRRTMFQNTKHGLTKATLIKSIKELNELKLLHVIKNTERNKTKYKIDYDNLQELEKIIKKNINKKASKTLDLKKEFQRVVLKDYNEFIKNNTTSSNKFMTTEKDLIKKDLIRKRNKCSKTFLTENDNSNTKTLTLEFFIKNKATPTITYYYIPMLLKKNEEIETLKDKLFTEEDFKAFQLIEYFLTKYYERYAEYHKTMTIDKFLELENHLIKAMSNQFIDNDIDIMTEIIDEYFNTKNTKRKRDLTLQLFLSKDKHDLIYSWINTIFVRLYGGTIEQKERDNFKWK